MPKQIIIDINKSILKANITEDESQGGKKALLTIPVQINFEKDELELIWSYIEKNDKFKSIRIKLPGYINLKTVLTKDIINEKIPNLMITINEKERMNSSSRMEYT